MAGTSGPEMPEGREDEDEAVTQFLMSIGLDCLTELFSRQKITMDILKEMTSENLKEAGVQEYGYRHKIIKELNKRKGFSESAQRSIYQQKRKANFEQHSLIPSKKHCILGKPFYQKPVLHPRRKSKKPRTQIPQIHQTAASTQTSSPLPQNNLSSTRNSNNHGTMQSIATQIIPQIFSSNSLSYTNSTSPATSNSQIATRSNNQTTLANIQSISVVNSQGTSQSIKVPIQSSVSSSATTCSTTASSSTSTCSSCTTASSHLTLTYDNDDAITEDENRFLRFLLLAQLGTEALRMAFDSKVPPPVLASHLQTHIRKLKERCTSQQMKVLFPICLVSTTNFDTTLLYTLFRNTVSVKAPSNGWGKDPRPHSTSLTDDIERVRIHRNSICHGRTSMDQLTFQRKWFDLSEAISRLSNGTLKKETSSLETRNFDKKARKSIMDDFDLLKNRVSELEQTHIPAHIKERQTEEIKVWEEDDEVFCETRAFNEFEEMMNIHNVVTIIGGPGTGKTTKARHLAIKYKSEGWEIIPVICLEDIKNFGHFSVKQLFLYDDPAGVFGFDRSRYNSLVDFTKIIRSLSEKQAKFVFTCRKAVYNEGRKLDLYIFQNTIDIESKRMSLTTTDMMKMLTIHCEKCRVEKSVYQSLSLKSGSVMFPLLCKLFSKEVQYQKDGERFFEMPKQCLVAEFEKMKLLNKTHYASLALCVLSQNKLNMHDWKETETLSLMVKQFRIEGSLSELQVCDALNEMNGTYVIKIDEIYTFVHDSIFEVMAYMYGREFPEIIISKMNSGYISRCVRLKPDAQSNLNSFVIIPEQTYPVLAERLYDDVKDKQFYDVFQNKCLKEQSFLHVFIKYLNTKSNDDLYENFLNNIDYVPHLIATEFIDKIEEGRKYIFERLIVGETYAQVMMTDSFMAEDEEIPVNITTYKTKYRIRALNWVVAYGHKVLFEFLMDRFSLNEIARKEMSLFSSYEQSHLLVLSTFSADSQITKKLIGYLDSNCIDQSPSGKFDSLNIHMCYTPLTATCVGENSETIDALLDAGADINKCDDMPEGDTPLTYVSKHGNIKIVEHLIMRNANIDKVNGCNKSPLYCASYFGHTNTVRYLVANKANVNICDAYNQSPLFVAAEKGFIEIVDILVQNGADVTICENNENKTALYQSISRNHLDISMLLLKSSVHDKLLNSDTINLILREGLDLNVLDSEGRSMLQWAIKKKDILICKNLTEHGAKVESLLENEIHSLWSYALMSYNFEDLKFTVKKFGQPLRTDILWNKFHLWKALAENNLEVVNVLLNLTSNSYNQDQILQELFTTAIHRGNIELVKRAVACQEEIVNKCEPSISLFGPKNTTPLNIAIQHGHADIVEYLVENGAYINMPDQGNKPKFYRALEFGDNETVENIMQHIVNMRFPKGFEDEIPLHFAVKNDQAEIVKYLLERGSEANTTDFRKNTPLYYALEIGKKEIVEYLVGHGAKVNVPDSSNETSLCKASENGLIEIVEYLVEHGAEVNPYDSRKKKPLCMASKKGHTKIVEYLVEHGADVNVNDSWIGTPLCVASENGHTKIVTYLVEHGADVNLYRSFGETPLCEASKNGHIKLAEYLVEHGAEINGSGILGGTPLCRASENGQSKMVEYLVEHGADINGSDSWEWKPLCMASENGHINIVEYLVEHGAEVNVSSSGEGTPLCMASKKGHINIVDYLVEHGAKVNGSGSWEEMPLCMASENGHTKIVEYLVEHGAQVNISGFGKGMSLCMASENGHNKIVEYLVEHGADINGSDSGEWKPLCRASENGHTNIVKYLIEHGAEVNDCDSWKRTPLCMASENGHTKIVEYLVEHGAEVNVYYWKVAPLYNASKNRHTKIVEYLVEHGAKDNFYHS